MIRLPHPGRKLYHFLGGLGLVALLYLLERPAALGTLLALLGLATAMDWMRIRIPAVGAWAQAHLGAFLREQERYRFSGTPPYLLGALLAAWLYPRDAAALAVAFLAAGDVAATTVGERFGRTRIGQKSLEGSLAFLVASLLAGVLLAGTGASVPLAAVAAGAVTATLVELLPLPVNDNLAVPVCSGGIVTLVHGWF